MILTLNTERIDMSKQKKYIPVYGSLTPTDAARLKSRAKVVGETEASLIRHAVILYLNKEEKANDNETMLAQRMKKMEDRLASIHAKTAIDVGVIYSLLWQNANYKTRDEQFIRARKHSVDRLRKKLKTEEADIKEAITTDD
jgi:hypothetical protein